MTPQQPNTSFADLLSRLLKHLGNLVRGEFALARAELVENLRAAQRGIVMIVIAALLGLVALNVLAASAVFAIVAAGLSPAISALIIGVVLIVIAAILIMVGAKALKPSNIVSTGTADRLRQDAQNVKERVRHEL